MSCPKCGTRVHRRKIGFLYLVTLLVIVSFGISLLVLPIELFFVAAIVLLIALRYVEKKNAGIDRREIRCHACGYVIDIAGG